MTFQTDQDPKKSQIVFDHSEGTNIFVEFIHMVSILLFICFSPKSHAFLKSISSGFFFVCHIGLWFLIKGVQNTFVS